MAGDQKWLQDLEKNRKQGVGHAVKQLKDEGKYDDHI